ncbi:MAG: hypothetical protein Q3972_01425 [Corynebacterium sp.]|nr:hypothetical protein [Corynebacterium sp.]
MWKAKAMSNKELLSKLEEVFTLFLHGLDDKEVVKRAEISDEVLMLMRNTIFPLNRARYRDLNKNGRRLSTVLYWVEPRDLEALKMAIDLAAPNFDDDQPALFSIEDLEGKA